METLLEAAERVLRSQHAWNAHATHAGATPIVWVSLDQLAAAVRRAKGVADDDYRRTGANYNDGS